MKCLWDWERGVLVTCSCSSLTDVKMCPFKPQVVTVVVGIFVVWNTSYMYSVFLLLELLSFKKYKICFVYHLLAYSKKNVFTTYNINGSVTTVIFSSTARVLIGII